MSHKKGEEHIKKHVYCGVLWCRNAPQPCMQVRVGVQVVPYVEGLRHNATLQYYPAYKQNTSSSNG